MSELLSNWDLAEAFYALDHAAPCDSAEWQASHRIRAHIYALTARAEAAERERDEAKEAAQVARDCIIDQAARYGEFMDEARAAALEEAARVAETLTVTTPAQIAAAIRALNPRHVRDQERAGDGPAERAPDASEEPA